VKNRKMLKGIPGGIILPYVERIGYINRAICAAQVARSRITMIYYSDVLSGLNLLYNSLLLLGMIRSKRKSYYLHISFLALGR
jgi:hypothetical protein